MTDKAYLGGDVYVEFDRERDRVVFTKEDRWIDEPLSKIYLDASACRSLLSYFNDLGIKEEEIK